MNRYYICRRLGNGSTQPDPEPYYSELQRYMRETYNMAPKQQVIAHTSPWCIMKYDVTAAQHSDIEANVSQVFSFPQGALDREVSTLGVAVRNAIASKMQAAGFDTSWIVGTNTIREIIQFIAHSIQLSEQVDVVGRFGADATDFNLRTMTVGDLIDSVGNITSLRIQERMETMGIDTTWVTRSTPLWHLVRRIQRQDDDVTPRLLRNGKRWFFHDSEAE